MDDGLRGSYYNANGVMKLSINGVFDDAFSNNMDVTSGTNTKHRCKYRVSFEISP